MRASEVVRLKVGDIDSDQMIIRVIQGKGKKDRRVKLPKDLLGLLRAWWPVRSKRLDAGKPLAERWLFPGIGADRPMSARQFGRLFQQTARLAGITKRVTLHSLRHSFPACSHIAAKIRHDGPDLRREARAGGEVARCEDCDHRVIAYDSCRDRHCPKCQGAAARTWLAEREAELLPVGYFHLVFTLPKPIADIAYQNKRVIHDLLFKAGADAMLTIAADKKHLGAT